MSHEDAGCVVRVRIGNRIEDVDRPLRRGQAERLARLAEATCVPLEEIMLAVDGVLVPSEDGGADVELDNRNVHEIGEDWPECEAGERLHSWD